MHHTRNTRNSSILILVANNNDSCNHKQIELARHQCRWYRDPNDPLPRSEVTRFPHAVLEVKLSLPEGQTTPSWVQELLEPDTIPEVRGSVHLCLSTKHVQGTGS